MIWRLTLLLFLLTSPAWATTYYVSNGGHGDTPSDVNNTCLQAQTITTPKLTPNGGASCLAAGDTLYLRGGTYSGARMDLRGKGGTTGNYTTISGYPGETATYAPTYLYDQNSAIIGTNSGPLANWLIVQDLILDGINGPTTPNDNTVKGIYLSGISNVIFQRNEIKRWTYNGIGMSGVAHIQVLNNNIHDQNSTCINGTRFYGLYPHDGDDILIDGNDIHHNPGGGVQVYSNPTNVIVRNNKIHHNNTFCVNGSAGVGGVIVQQDLTLGGPVSAKLYNNLVYANGFPTDGSAGAGIANGIELNVGVSGILVENNTTYGNKNLGVYVNAAAGANNVIRNNIGFGNLGTGGGPDIKSDAASNILDHNFTSDPHFVNAAAFDFRLQSGSGAIDTGVSLSSLFTTDFAGVTRPQGSGWDIGAYEFVSDLTPPSTPTLTATATSSAQINVSWTTATDNVGVTAYLLERCTGAACGSFVQITSTSLTSLLDTGLSAGTTYRYRVRATDAAGNLGAYSNIVSATTVAADVTPPSAPTNLHQVNVTQTTADLAWTASTDNIAVAGYQMSRCQGASCTPNTLVTVGTPSATTFSDSGLLCGTTYRYSVQAVDTSANVGAASGILTVTTLGCLLPPVAPSGVTLAATSDFARHTISWTWSQGGGTAADGFHVQCGKTTLARTTSTTVAVGAPMQLFMKDFLPGQGSWFCTVTAYNAGGDSAEATEASTVVLGPGFGAWGFAF